MIVERNGNRNVLVRHRDNEGKRIETVIRDIKPYGFLLDEDAQHIPALAKEDGYYGRPE